MSRKVEPSKARWATDREGGREMNETYVTVIGNVASDVRYATTDGGIPVASFRVASTPRRYSPSGWTDGQTSYVTIKCWRGLAENVQGSLKKGHPVVVHGRQTVRPWDRGDGRTGTSVDIDADAVGHDLRRGTSEFSKNARQVQERDGSESAAAELASSFDVDEPVEDETGGEESPFAAGAAHGGDGWSVPGVGAAEAA